MADVDDTLAIVKAKNVDYWQGWKDHDKLPAPTETIPPPPDPQKGSRYALRNYLAELGAYCLAFAVLYLVVYAVSAGWHDGKER